MRKLSIIYLSLIAIVIILFVICFYQITKKIASQKNTGLQVVTSFYPLYFFATEIAKNKAEIRNITPAGAEPHDYEPTPNDMVYIEKSDLVILNGINLESWGKKITDELKNKNIITITTGDNLAKNQDPHVWLSPSLAKKQVELILHGFEKVDPENKDTYRKNADNLKQKLDILDNHFKTGLGNCKENNFVTSHAAFGYLAESYGLNQKAISGISPDEEPSANKLAEVASFAKKNNLKYIFFESTLSPKLSETIAREVGAQTLVLDPVEGLTDDKIKKGGNYFSIMENNLKNLRAALVCK